MMKKLIICRGIQGSGKTTYAKQWVLEDSEHRVRFNNDDIRNMLDKYWVPNREKVVRSMLKAGIEQAMLDGYDIIIDNMNLNSMEIGNYQYIVGSFNQNRRDLVGMKMIKPKDNFRYRIEYQDFFIPLKDCIERDSKRDNPIGEEIITSTYNKYKNIIEKDET